HPRLGRGGSRGRLLRVGPFTSGDRAGARRERRALLPLGVSLLAHYSTSTRTPPTATLRRATGSPLARAIASARSASVAVTPKAPPPSPGPSPTATRRMAPGESAGVPAPPVRRGAASPSPPAQRTAMRGGSSA